MRDEKLYQVCKDWMKQQSKLELLRDYNDYLDGNQVAEFISYCEEQIEKGYYHEPITYLYDWFTGCQTYDWFNDYESEQFHDTFVHPFLEQYPEYEDNDEVNEILRELMYDLDKYDSDLDHFDKEYHFYLLTNPELTYELYDEGYPFVEYKHKYLKSLIRSQGRTANSQSMQELLSSGGYNGLGICIMLNYSLFDFINLMKAKKLTVKKGTDVYMFNPYIGTGGDTTKLTSDRSFSLNIKEIGFGCDDARRGCRGYTPCEVYGWYYPYFDHNRVTFKSFKK